jgi:hypothetical protein
VIVAAGVTVSVPPLDESEYALPSEPVIFTVAALVAVTVKVEELPALMDVGLAAMFTVGGGVVTALTVTVAVAVALLVVPVAVAV